MQGAGGGQCSKSAWKNSHGICVCGILSMPVPQPALLVIANTLHEIAIIMQVHPSAQLSQCATSAISPF